MSPWSRRTKGTIRPNSSYHAPKATQMHMAEISSNNGHIFLSQYVLSRPHKLLVVQKFLPSNRWRHVEEGKRIIG